MEGSAIIDLQPACVRQSRSPIELRVTAGHFAGHPLLHVQGTLIAHSPFPDRLEVKHTVTSRVQTGDIIEVLLSDPREIALILVRSQMGRKDFELKWVSTMSNEQWHRR
jgi:hypothetical protein